MTMRQPPASTRPGPVLVRGVLAWGDSYLAWARRHPLIIDGALVAVLLLLSWPEQPGFGSASRVLPVALVFAMVLPLVWRRRAPFLVFLIISAVALAQALTGKSPNADLAMLVAFYTIVAYQPPRRILAAALILEAGAVLVAWRWSPPRSGTHAAGVWVLISSLVTTTGFVGYWVRTRR